MWSKGEGETCILTRTGVPLKGSTLSQDRTAMFSAMDESAKQFATQQKKRFSKGRQWYSTVGCFKKIKRETLQVGFWKRNSINSGTITLILSGHHSLRILQTMIIGKSSVICKTCIPLELLQEVSLL